MDLVVERNAFGRQLQSFETDLKIAGLGEEPFRAVFIRAPAISVDRAGVDVLASLENGTIVAARQDSLLVSCFHPELTSDDRFHRAFLEQVRAYHAWAQPSAQTVPGHLICRAPADGVVSRIVRQCSLTRIL